MTSILQVSHLSTWIQARKSEIRAVQGVDLRLEAGETLCLVGESGCGKSMTGLSIMGLLPAGGRIVSGSIRLNGRELVGLADSEMSKIRGNDIAMIFQNPISSLNPARTVGYQVSEPLRKHRGLGKRDALNRAEEALAVAGVPHPRERLSHYPHELSGGLRQRVMIAMALVCEPTVLIADEPTTALDVTIQYQILQLLENLKARLGMAVLLITHDMGVVARCADRVSVMYAGRLVESTKATTLFNGARHPYTRGLLASIPRTDHDSRQPLASIPGTPPDLGHLPPGCHFADRCFAQSSRCHRDEPELTGNDEHSLACWHPLDITAEQLIAPRHDGDTARRPAAEQLLDLRSVVKEFLPRRRSPLARRATVNAVSGVSLSISRGETFGLVGESGCGKTTLARMTVALDKPTAGDVIVTGESIVSLSGSKLRLKRRDIQIMYQDPYSSLDPRMRVGAILREPLMLQRVGDREEQEDAIARVLAEVGLDIGTVDRYPRELSGGQRQRVGLARALILKPRLIVADEPVSALDVSIRSQVLNLMKEVQATHGLSYLVISHDLTVIRYLADRVGVMYLGKLVETGGSEDIYLRPVHPYTASLIRGILIPDPARERSKPDVAITGEVPSAIDPPSGCRFRTRCPRAAAICAGEEPSLRSFGEGHMAACHFPLSSPTEVEIAVG